MDFIDNFNEEKNQSLTEFATNISYQSLKCFSYTGRNSWKGILQIIESALKVWEKLSDVLDFVTLKEKEKEGIVNAYTCR